MSKLEKRCRPLRNAIKNKFVYEPGTILEPTPGGRLEAQEYYIGTKNDYMYINNCPFCGEDLNVEK